MEYVVKAENRTVPRQTYSDYGAAIQAANGMFGSDVRAWIHHNVRIEQTAHDCNMRQFRIN